MKILNRQELIEYFHTTESVINTNFPLFCSKQLSKGYLITKRGKGKTAVYEVQKVKPENKSKDYFSTKKQEIAQDLPGEIWATTYCEKNFEVSNFGRVRNKITKQLHHASNNGEGYLQVSILNNNYRVHRLVLQSFYPVDDPNLYTVDHINGIRSDNNLNNLRWLSNEENVQCMILQRKDLNKELTRLIQKYGYEKTLEILCGLD